MASLHKRSFSMIPDEEEEKCEAVADVCHNDGTVNVPKLFAVIMGTQKAVKGLKGLEGAAKPIRLLRRDKRLTKCTGRFASNSSWWADSLEDAYAVISDYVPTVHRATFEAFRKQFDQEWHRQLLQQRRQDDERQHQTQLRHQLKIAARQLPQDVPSELSEAVREAWCVLRAYGQDSTGGICI